MPDNKLNEFQKLAIAFGNTFTTESGKLVLAEFERLALTPSYEPGIEDPERAPFWHEGRRSIFLLCKYMMGHGAELMTAIAEHKPVHDLGAETSILDESEED